jgi:cell division protein FtsQ
MRYERQVVLEMPPGSNASAAPSGTATNTNMNDAPAKKSSADSPEAQAKTTVGSKTQMDPAKPVTHTVAQSETAFAVPAKKKSAPKAKPHAVAAKHHPAVAKVPASATQYHPPQVVHP